MGGSGIARILEQAAAPSWLIYVNRSALVPMGHSVRQGPADGHIVTRTGGPPAAECKSGCSAYEYRFPTTRFTGLVQKKERGSYLRRILAALGAAASLMGTPVLASGAEAAAHYNRFYYGQCTWWAANERPDIGAKVWGNAANWIGAAQSAGLPTGSTPKVGAIVVYQPGAQGAWGTGHVAHVIAVSPDGNHFTVDEMNYPRAGVVTHRLSHAGAGVGFIY